MEERHAIQVTPDGPVKLPVEFVTRASETEGERIAQPKERTSPGLPPRPKIEKPEWKKEFDAVLAQYDEVHLSARNVQTQIKYQRETMERRDHEFDEVVKEGTEARDGIDDAERAITRAEADVAEANARLREATARRNKFRGIISNEEHRLQYIRGEMSAPMYRLKCYLEDHC